MHEFIKLTKVLSSGHTEPMYTNKKWIMVIVPFEHRSGAHSLLTFGVSEGAGVASIRVKETPEQILEML